MKKTSAFLAMMLYSNFTSAAGWNALNDPWKLDRNLSSYYGSLPLAGEIYDDKKGWPTSHWPNYTGGIAYRWSSSDPRPFVYKTLSLAQLKKTVQYKLDELSPAEKFDVYRRDYSYRLTRSVLKSFSPNENQWHGLCHGTAPASLHHHEPRTVTITNGDGVTLTFYSSDVSALMSHYYANVAKTRVAHVGKRCYLNNSPSAPNCQDLNAGSFHIILANKLGLTGESFIADIDPKHEVWNHVPVKFISLPMGDYPPGESSAPGTVIRAKLETVVTYAAAIAPKFGPVIGTPDAMYAENTYEYYLDIDRDGRIIGGDWIGERRPDFIWVKDKATFQGEWAVLNELYKSVD